MNYTKFPTAQDAVNEIAQQLQAYSQQHRPVHISLSGGSTPKLLFKTLASQAYNQTIQWQNLHFWWGDERMVNVNSPESNYGEAKRLLFDHIDIPAENIHPICGDANPKLEVKRIEQQINALVPNQVFDWIILGMGTDGHTASLFPGQTNFDEQSLMTIASHPETGAIRISKTVKLIEQAKRITFLVTGDNKAQLLNEIYQANGKTLPYPAAQIKAKQGITEWFIDNQAGQLL